MPLNEQLPVAFEGLSEAFLDLRNHPVHIVKVEQGISLVRVLVDVRPLNQLAGLRGLKVFLISEAVKTEADPREAPPDGGDAGLMHQVHPRGGESLEHRGNFLPRSRLLQNTSSAAST